MKVLQRSKRLTYKITNIWDPTNLWSTVIWIKVFKNTPGKILKNLKEYGLPKADHTPSNYLKAVFRKF